MSLLFVQTGISSYRGTYDPWDPDIQRCVEASPGHTCWNSIREKVFKNSSDRFLEVNEFPPYTLKKVFDLDIIYHRVRRRPDVVHWQNTELDSVSDRVRILE